MSMFNDNHKRAILSTFQNVDKQLDEIRHIFEVMKINSHFQKYIPDVTPASERIIEADITHIRNVMFSTLKANDINIDIRYISAERSARITIDLAWITLEEMRSKYLSGYGSLSDEASRELDAIVSRLQGLLNQMRGRLVKSQETTESKKNYTYSP